MYHKPTGISGNVLNARREAGRQGPVGRRGCVPLPALLIVVGLLATACSGLVAPGAPEPTSTFPAESAPDETPSGDGQSDVVLPLRRRRDNDIHFERLSLEEGLSQSVVLSIFQDSRGFLWFGTQDGLNRYDGYEFVVYKNDPEDPNSLSNNWVQVIREDQSSVLWIGTNGGGLDRFDRETGQFTHYQSAPDDPHSLSHDVVNTIYQDREGTLWIGTGGGLDRFDRETGQFIRYANDPDDPYSLSEGPVESLYQDQEGVLWVGTNGGGLARFNHEAERFVHYQNDPDDPHSLSHNQVCSILEDQSGALWIGTLGGGLDRFDREAERFIHYRNDPDDPKSLGYDSVEAIYQDREGVLWIGTFGGGLDRFDSETGGFVHYRNDAKDPHSLSENTVFSVYEDQSGVLWIGTFGGGLSKYDRGKEKFVHYQHDPNDPSSLGSSGVWSFYEDRKGVFWIGTSEGLDRFDRAAGRFSHYKNDPEDPHSLSPGSVMSIYQDREGVLWFGTSGGLDKLDQETRQFTHYEHETIVWVHEDREGVFWTASWGGGLDRFDRETGQFTHFENDPDDPHGWNSNYPLTISEDPSGALWIATFDAGLSRFDREMEQFTHYRNDPDDPHSLGNDAILSIHQDREGVLWLGTVGGLDRFDPATETFTHYREKDGLPNNVIYGILEDDEGNLWMSTNRGLSRFNPQTETFTNYDVGDGLQSNEFNQNAYYRSSSGEMFFGGINGFNVFHPQGIRENPFAPPVVLTSLTQGGEGVDLDQTVDTVTEVTFRWPNNFFEFEFAALSYAEPDENQYAYMLEGFEEDWNDVGTRRFGRYTNVPGGTYTLRIKGASNDGIWNQEGVSVSVAFVPPFWQTWWFRILAAVLVVGGALGGLNLRVRVVETQKQQLEIQVDERTRELQDALVQVERSREAAEAANRAKSVFLANMSHELRTPLNAVLGFTQLMSQDSNLTAEQQENLETINRSGEHLLDLINDVLELSKIEAGRMTLNEQGFDLYRLLDTLEDMFRLRAEDKGLTLIFDRAPDVPQYVWMDEGKLRQVLMNLLGNAVKFTEVGGVALRIGYLASLPPDNEGEVEGAFPPRLRFEVEDTGVGIAPEELEAVFAPFEQTTSGRQSQDGTGLGLTISREFVDLMGGAITVRSKVGEGSVFRFEVPLELADEAVVLMARPTRRVIGLEPGQPDYRLLIVEDNWANRRLLVKLLEPLGFEVREAVNGREAIEVWERWQPHLIWMDMRMPVMDGYEAARRIKATPKGQATIIIALTASAFEEDREMILAGDCDDFVAKPFREDKIFGKLEKHLGVRFVYEDRLPLPAHAGESAQDVLPVAALPAAMAALPPDLVIGLQQATIQADLESIRTLIDQIREHDIALANALADLARDFDHDAILKLIDSLEADL